MVAWALNLAMEQAPFRFPGPVLGTLVFFFALLILDWLSGKFPGKSSTDPANADVEVQSQRRKRKRFVDPVMAVLAPPCDFLLRNMSLLFTPAFVLIPARETIPGKEIGILAGWFLITQVIAFVLPVLICWVLEWLYGVPKRVKRAREHQLRRERRNSSLTMGGMDWEKRKSYGGGDKLGPIATGLSGLTAVVVAPVSHVKMDSTEDDREQNQRRHIAGVELERARQQGEPLPASIDPALFPPSDVSSFWHPGPSRDGHHLHGHHHHRHTSQERAMRSLSAPRNRSRSRPRSAGNGVVRPSSARGATFTHGSQRGTDESSSTGRRPGSRGRRGLGGQDGASAQEGIAGPPRPTFASIMTAPVPFRRATADASGSPFNPSFTFEGTTSSDSKHSATAGDQDLDPLSQPGSVEIQQPPAAKRSMPQVLFRGEVGSSDVRRSDVDGQSKDLIEVVDKTAVNSVRNSTSSPQQLEPTSGTIADIPVDEKGVPLDLRIKDAAAAAAAAAGGGDKDVKTFNDQDKDQTDGNDEDDEDDEDEDANDADSSSDDGPDAVERLADWISDLFTPFVYFCLFIVGLPLWFMYDIALLLHLSINILTFWLAITVIPAKMRRFAHPILTTSVATVLLIWAFGAMRGQSLKTTLSYYDRDAKFDVLWNPSGYNGPIPGTGDVLSSLLDAGIVALFVPLYRYRQDLKECGVRIFVALVPCVALSLFVWPTVGALMGLDQIRALAFAARFLSTPLAIELVQTLEGDESITVILVVITGIIAALLKEPFFKMMRVSMDDHLIVGVTFGATSGAIGASSLIARPRVMAVASLGFVMFGTLALIAAAIPPIVALVRDLAAL